MAASARTRWSRGASCRLSGLPQRLLLLSYFEPDDVPNLLAQVGRARLPPDLPVYVGSYGANPATGAHVAALPSGRYAAMFALNEPWYRERRRLPPEYDPLVPKRFAGQVPPLNSLTSTSARVSWGVELGARYRDVLRAARDAGVTIDAWQFDEIVTSAARSSGVPLREFIRGVLRGLLFARPVLQDNPMQGFVWVAHLALGIAQLPLTQELTTFWRTLNRAALRYVGEEYPRFEGNPRRVAQAQSVGQRALAAGGPERRALSRRYVPGMTPGYHLVAGLGGNVHHWSRPQVNSWRATYVDERARTGVAGFGEFDFRFGNSAPTVMHDVMSALAAGVGIGA
ncbi:MAG TPA: hypothetical protein VEL10_08075 [Gaiellaceae bacterium]|nr:hypothetical protein [Gaiellaceae bacterium]